MKFHEIAFALLVSFSLTAMEHDFGGEKQEDETNLAENNFDKLPNEIVEKIFSNLSYQDQQSLLCVDKRLSPFKKHADHLYLGYFNFLPLEALYQIFIEYLKIDISKNARDNISNVNRHFSKLIFELLLELNIKIGVLMIRTDIPIDIGSNSLVTACNYNAWIWLKDYIKINKNQIKTKNFCGRKIPLKIDSKHFWKIMANEISKFYYNKFFGSPSICKVLLQHGAPTNLKIDALNETIGELFERSYQQFASLCQFKNTKMDKKLDVIKELLNEYSSN